MTLRDIKKQLVFVSVGSALDMHGPNTSIMYRGDKTILMDCGYAVPPKFCTAYPDPHLLDAIYLSHQHADHSFGLPALLAWMKAMGRKRPLRLMHGPKAEVWIRTLLDVGYPGSFAQGSCFPIEFNEIRPDRETLWDSSVFKVARSQHRVPNWSLRIDESNLSIAYSGDGCPTEETIALFQGVTHLVHECSWARKLKDGHADAASLLAHARDWNVRHMHLVHILQQYKSDVLARVVTFDGKTCVTVPSAGKVISLDE
jgi:ribonuclease Z